MISSRELDFANWLRKSTRFPLWPEMIVNFQLSFSSLVTKYSLCSMNSVCEHRFIEFKSNLSKKISVNITGRHCTEMQRKIINIGVKICYWPYWKSVNAKSGIISFYKKIVCYVLSYVINGFLFYLNDTYK